MNIVNNDRMTKIISVILAVIFGVLVITLTANAVTTISTSIVTAGDITTSAGNIEATAGTLTVGGASTLTGAATLSSTLAVTATTTLARNLVITHTDVATSSVQVGCIQTYATSTDSPINMTFFATSTLNIDGASVTSGFGGNAIQGLVLWSFGKCPRI